MEKTLKINGMHCKSCEVLISDVLAEIKGIEKVKVDSKEGFVKFNYKDEHVLSIAKQAIEKEGYTVIA